jgi:hypothetical protein
VRAMPVPHNEINSGLSTSPLQMRHLLPSDGTMLRRLVARLLVSIPLTKTMPFVRLGALTVLGVATLAGLTPSAHADEGHIYRGVSGFGTEFFLIGGQYHLYVNAQRNFGRVATSLNRACTFVGHFSRMALATDTTIDLPMGGPAQITTFGYTLDRQVTLPPGLYRLHLDTDCLWKFFIVSTAENAAGLAQVTMSVTTAGQTQSSTTVSLRDHPRFSADFRTDHNATQSVSGTLQVIHDGKVVGTFPLQSGVGLPVRSQFVFVDLTWEPGDAKYVGKNIATLVVKIGPTEFTSSEEFTLTP